VSELKRLVRAGFGFIADELRQRRAADRRMELKLDAIGTDIKELVRLAGGADAKVQAIREDFDALRDGKVDEHERKIANHERRIQKIVDSLPAVPGE
jgi:hypothetical protein